MNSNITLINKIFPKNVVYDCLKISLVSTAITLIHEDTGSKDKINKIRLSEFNSPSKKNFFIFVVIMTMYRNEETI